MATKPSRGLTVLVALAVLLPTTIVTSPMARADTPSADSDSDYALVLDGSSTTARTSGTTRLITTAAFTVEAWILYDGGNKGKYRNFLNQYVSSSNRIYVGLNNTNNNQLKFAWGGDTVRDVPLEQFTIPENQWFHVAMTRTSGGSVALYIDGVLISAPGATSTGIPNTHFQVGARGTSEYVPGQIDQVKVWNSALTEAQIRRSMHAYSDSDGAGTIAATLAAHYDFNAGTGDTVINSVGTDGPDLTVTAAAYSQDSIMTESVVGSDKVVTFRRTFLPSAGGWSVPAGVAAVRSLVVAGGGGGGSDEGGGGGAGGFLETSDQSVSGVEPVVVGQGGLGGYSITGTLERRPTSGQGSSFGSTSKVAATGGGAGGDASDGSSAANTAAIRRGLDGGSGGGAAGERVAATGGSGTSPQGNDGASTLSNQDAGGGGGGAGGAATTRAGGPGLQSTITGTSPAPFYAAGGSGGLGNSGTATQPGTDGIGGAGGSSTGSATRGVVNTGSGGGGGPFLGSGRSGAGGGSGVVIVRYTFEHTVTYDYNDGSGSPASATYTVGGTGITLPSPTRAGYAFDGWYSDAGFTTFAGAAAASFTTSTDVTLFARWTAQSQTITYGANTGTGTVAATTGATGSPVSLSGGAGFTRAGYALSGWNTQADGSGTGYELGQTVSMPSGGLTLFARWTAQERFITYFSDDGSGRVLSESGSTDAPLMLSTNPFPRAGYVLSSWNTLADGSGTAYAPGAQITMPPDGLTLRAQWTAQSQTITYEATAGSGTVTATTGDTDSSVSLSGGDGFARAGYSLSGWNTQADGSGTAYGLGSTLAMPAGGLTLFAQWAAQSRTITYEATAGSGTIAATTGETDSSVSLSGGVGFSRAGYTLSGWNTQVDGSGTAYALGQTVPMPAGGLTLFAQWTADTYTVTFAAGSRAGSTGADVTVTKTHDVGLTLPDSADANSFFVRTGYTVTGWSTSEDGSTLDHALGGTYTDESPVTLHPVWTPDTYTVTYAYEGADGGDSTATADYTVDGIVVSLPMPTRTGFLFAGWYSDAGLTTLVGLGGAGYAPTGDVTLFAKWTAATFTVLYDYRDADGGDGVALATYTTGGTAITLPTPTRTGYTFAGWYADAALSVSVGAAGASYAPTANRTLLAKWVAITRSVTYRDTLASSGSVPVDRARYIIGDTVVVRANSGGLSRAGYTLEGWTTSADGTGTLLNVGETLTVATTDIDLHPRWSASTFTITYLLDGGDGDLTGAPTSWTTGTANVTLPSTGFTRTGFDFDGWQALGTTTKVNTSYQPGFADVTLVARWAITNVPYTFSKGTAAGTTITGWPADASALFGTTITLRDLAGTSVTIGDETFVFFGWEHDGSTYASGAPFVLGESALRESAPTFTARWLQTFDVRYGFGGGTHGVAGDGAAECTTGGLCKDGQPITLRTAPTRAGYTFGGWKVQDTVTVKAAGAAHTVTETAYQLFAQWTAILYPFTFNSLGGTIDNSPIERSIGQVVTLPDPGLRAGYTFAGWTADGDTGPLAVGASYVVGTSGRAFSAEWTPDVYTVTYDWQGGATATPRISDAFTVGTGAMTLPSAEGSGYTRDGFTFSGWSTSPGGQLVTGYQPTGHVVLYAVWADGNFTLSFEARGGTLPAIVPTAVPRGKAATLPMPTRANFTFLGWFDAASGGEKVGDAGSDYVPTGSLTLHARWIQNSLFGVDLATLETGSTYTASSASSTDTTLTHVASGTSARVQIPSGALPDGTVVTVRYFKETSRQSELIPGENTYFFALLVSWILGSGVSATVPDTAPGKPIVVTLTNPDIKAGAIIYQVIGTVVTELGRATVDGSITVELTEDPEIVVAATRPGAPSTVSGTAGDTAATVSWTPGSSGGSEVTGYTVTASPGGAGCTTASATSTSCTITSLTNNTAYTFTVTAVNALGTSDPSPASAAVTPVGAVYSVTFVSNGGSAVAPSSFFSGGSMDAPTAPTRTGYTLAGWSATDGGTPVAFPYAPGVTRPITLYARWTANTYTVTYATGGGSAIAAGSFVTGGAIAVTPSSPTRLGYTFDGWAATSGGPAVAFPYSPGIIGDITLHARWLPAPQSVVYRVNSGSGSIASGSADTATQIVLSSGAGFSRAGYLLTAWNTQADGGGTTYALGASLAMPPGGLTLYARWTAQVHEVTYSTGGGSMVGPGSFPTDGSILTAPTPPTRAGYTFDGWAAAGDPAAVTFPYSPGVIGAITLSARWIANTYTVTYATNGGSTVAAGTFVTAGSIAGPPDAPTRTGYTFGGWATTNGGPAVSFPYTPGVMANITLHARWTANTYQLTFAPGSISGVTGTVRTTTKTHDLALTLPDSATANGYFTRSGHVVIGWSVNADGSTIDFPLGSAYATEGVATLFPAWGLATFAVTFEVRGGSAVASGGFLLGGAISAPSPPVRPGHAFRGWSTVAGDATTSVTFPYTPGVAAAITLHALWDLIPTAPAPTSGDPGTGEPETSAAGTGIAGGPASVLPPADAPVFLGPTQIVPGRGFDPGAGSRALVAGRTVEVASTPLDVGGLLVRAGRVQVGISPTTRQTPAPVPSVDEMDVTVARTETLRASGSGLLPGSRLQVWLPGLQGVAPIELGRIAVQVDGTFVGDLALAAQRSGAPVQVGRQTLQVTGYDETGSPVVIEMTVDVLQGPPRPELLAATGALPSLAVGGSLVTSSGTPETVSVEVRPERGEVAAISTGGWNLTLSVPGEAGTVMQLPTGTSITLGSSGLAAVSGSGLLPGTRVDVWLFSEPVLLGSVIVASDGSFLGNVQLDAARVVSGDHTLQIQGVANDGYVKAANFGVAVEAPSIAGPVVAGSDGANVSAPGAPAGRAAATTAWAWILLSAIVLAVGLMAARRRCGRADEDASTR